MLVVQVCMVCIVLFDESIKTVIYVSKVLIPKQRIYENSTVSKVFLTFHTNVTRL